MTITPLNWGILSTAKIARGALLPAIHRSTTGRVVAVASRDLTRARDFAEGNAVPRALGSYEALLEDPEVEAIYVPLPNSMHREWTLRAVEAGKHVLCEKPLAVSAAECREMDDAARRHGVTLMEAFMYRFHPRTQRVLEMVRDGVIGSVHAIHSSFSFRLRARDNIRLLPELGGGALMDVGCYCVNVIRTLAGREPTRVVAWAQIGTSGVDEQLWGMLEFDGDLVGQFDCALTRERRESYRVAGTEGQLDVDDAFRPGDGPVTIREHHDGREPVDHAIAGVDEYQLMVEHFASCVRERKDPIYPAREAAANMEVIEALRRSVRQETPIRMDAR